MNDNKWIDEGGSMAIGGGSGNIHGAGGGDAPDWDIINNDFTGV